MDYYLNISSSRLPHDMPIPLNSRSNLPCTQSGAGPKDIRLWQKNFARFLGFVLHIVINQPYFRIRLLYFLLLSTLPGIQLLHPFLFQACLQNSM